MRLNIFARSMTKIPKVAGELSSHSCPGWAIDLRKLRTSQSSFERLIHTLWKREVKLLICVYRKLLTDWCSSFPKHGSVHGQFLESVNWWRDGENQQHDECQRENWFDGEHFCYQLYSSMNIWRRMLLKTRNELMNTTALTLLFIWKSYSYLT